MMRIYFFLFVLLFSVSLVAQSTKEEKGERQKAKKTNSNVVPLYQNKVESEMDEAPTGSSFSNMQSSVITNASLNIQNTLEEIKQMFHQKSPTSQQVQKLNYELIKIKNANQNAFEYYLYNYKIGNYDFDRIEDLKMAAKLQPNHPEVLKSLSAYYYIQGDSESLKQQLSKMYSAKHFSSQLSGFAVDVLKSMPENTILITHGEDDTYPLLIEQFVHKTRQDVRVISLDHLQSADFRDKLKKDGLIVPTGNTINTNFFKELISQNSEKIVIATSIPQSYLSTVSNSINVEGLGFGVSSNSKTKSQQKRLVKLYDDHINMALNQKIKSGGYNKLLGNYLPLLFEIRNYWIDKGDNKRVKDVENQIINIGRQTNKLERILQILK
jgi:hypothetical protein